MTTHVHRRRVGHGWAWCLPSGLFHREDGPAVERDDGTIEWHSYGLRHREDGPAVIAPDHPNQQPGWQEWWVMGRRHRAGGPAFVSSDSEEWWLDGELHRDDGPAWIKYRPDPDRRWYSHGLLHRDDGPAVEYPDGTVEFTRGASSTVSTGRPATTSAAATSTSSVPTAYPWTKPTSSSPFRGRKTW